MSNPLVITVMALPAPQGSKSPKPIYRGKKGARVFTGKVAVVESSKNVKPWREAVVAAAMDVLRMGPEDEQGMATRIAYPFDNGPVEVCITFTLPRPKGHYGTGRNAGKLKPSAPAFPTGQRDDIDKLSRSTLDALVGAYVLADDGQIVDLSARKRYPNSGPDTLPGPGAIIRVFPVEIPLAQQALTG